MAAFNPFKTGQDLKINDSNVPKRPTNIFVNNFGNVAECKQVWINDSTKNPKLVWPLGMEVFKISGAGCKGQEGDGQNNYNFLIQRENGSTATFPAGWTGKVAFWQTMADSDTQNDPPDHAVDTRAPVNCGIGCGQACASCWFSGQGWLQLFFGSENLGLAFINSRTGGAFQCSGGLLGSPLAYCNIPIGTNLKTSYSGIAGNTPYIFNNFYNFSTPLTSSVNSLFSRMDAGSWCKKQPPWNMWQRSRLRMAVLTTSTVQIA